MPDISDFTSVYLREVGVNTPASLLRSGAIASEKNKIGVLSEDLELLALQAANCQHCGLCDARKQVVFGAGDQDAEIVFIVDVPDMDENNQGLALLGSSGELFDAMLVSMHLSRQQVYVLHMVKCMTPKHRDPSQEEVSACRPWLDQQLKILQPRLVLVMGRMAAQGLLSSDASLHDMRGSWHTYQNIPLRVIHHPSYLIRSSEQKMKAWEDMQIIHQFFEACEPSQIDA